MITIYDPNTGKLIRREETPQEKEEREKAQAEGEERERREREERAKFEPPTQEDYESALSELGVRV